jgi:prepilin-type N-terminal cleavage/methylation domain-containing protein
MRLYVQAGWRPAQARSGFSLVEIMVVIFIVGILVSLVAAGAFQVISARRSSNTELTAKKVDEALQRQWRKVIDQASQEPIPEVYLNTQYDSNGRVASWGLLDMAGGDVRRARVIWIKLRLRHEFPQNLREVLFPNGGPHVGRPDPNNNNQFVTYLPQFAGVNLPKQTYYRAILNAHRIPANQTDLVPSENSAMLLLSLTQGRTGGDFNQDDLGPDAIGYGIYDFPPGVIPLPSPTRIRMPQIVDAWNQPIVFWRWPIGNPDVENSNPAFGASLAQKFRDPLDPEGLLVQSSWNNWNNYRTYQGVWAFELMFHWVHWPLVDASGTPQPYTQASQPRAYYSTPVVVSAGKNETLGTFGAFLPPLPAGTPPGWPPHPSLLPDHMISNNTSADHDNIFSHRLRLGARGD